MSLLPKSIHRCRRYPTKFNSGRDIPLLRRQMPSSFSALPFRTLPIRAGNAPSLDRAYPW